MRLASADTGADAGPQSRHRPRANQEPFAIRLYPPRRYSHATPIPFVSVQPMPGWTISTEKAKLDKPVKTDDGEITEAVTKVTWTATAGGLNPGEFDLFTVSAGPLPTNTKQLAFPTLQTYSNGEVVRWIQATAKGAPEPDFPVPTLTLTKASSGHH